MAVRGCGLILGMRHPGSAAARKICFTAEETNFLDSFIPCAGRDLEKSNCVACKPPQSGGVGQGQKTPEALWMTEKTKHNDGR